MDGNLIMFIRPKASHPSAFTHLYREFHLSCVRITLVVVGWVSVKSLDFSTIQSNITDVLHYVQKLIIIAKQ